MNRDGHILINHDDLDRIFERQQALVKTEAWQRMVRFLYAYDPRLFFKQPQQVWRFPKGGSVDKAVIDDSHDGLLCLKPVPLNLKPAFQLQTVCLQTNVFSWIKKNENPNATWTCFWAGQDSMFFWEKLIHENPYITVSIENRPERMLRFWECFEPVLLPEKSVSVWSRDWREALPLIGVECRWEQILQCPLETIIKMKINFKESLNLKDLHVETHWEGFDVLKEITLQEIRGHSQQTHYDVPVSSQFHAIASAQVLNIDSGWHALAFSDDSVGETYHLEQFLHPFLSFVRHGKPFEVLQLSVYQASSFSEENLRQSLGEHQKACSFQTSESLIKQIEHVEKMFPLLCLSFESFLTTHQVKSVFQWITPWEDFFKEGSLVEIRCVREMVPFTQGVCFQKTVVFVLHDEGVLQTPLWIIALWVLLFFKTFFTSEAHVSLRMEDKKGRVLFDAPMCV